MVIFLGYLLGALHISCATSEVGVDLLFTRVGRLFVIVRQDFMCLLQEHCRRWSLAVKWESLAHGGVTPMTLVDSQRWVGGPLLDGACGLG